MANVIQIFISHAHEDREFAHRLARDLSSLGFQIWIAPESILPSESWVDAIERGLESSSHVALVLTQAACQSSWVKKEMEVAIAQERKGQMKVIPLEVGECKPPLLWGTYQKVTFCREYQKGFTALCSMLGAAPKAPAVPPTVSKAQKPRQEAPRPAAPVSAPGPTTCDLCGKTFSTTDYLAQHKAKSHILDVWPPPKTASAAAQSSDQAICETCGKTFASKKSLEQHKADKHPVSSVSSAWSSRTASAPLKVEVTCIQCGKKFSSLEYLNQHMASAHQFVSNECFHCGKFFLSRELLEQHIASEHRMFPHTCPQCGKPFVNRKHLDQHIKAMHPR